MSNREFIHDIVLQVAVLVAFFAIMGAITSWNCARCDAALNRTVAASATDRTAPVAEAATVREEVAK